jgi:hypothetical protein
MAAKARTQRINFTIGTRRAVAQKAMYLCSNPECLRVTGFVTAKGKPRAIAQVAHIQAAAAGGPRREDIVVLPDGSMLERGSEGNAIWLCVPCHIRVDSDADSYPSELLVEWKNEHEQLISSLVGLDLEQSLLKLGGMRRSHDVAHDLLRWIDSHRFMWNDESYEFPKDVHVALDQLRYKLTAIGAGVYRADSVLLMTVDQLEAAVLRFFDAFGTIRIDDIVATSGTPQFDLFMDALTRLRFDIMHAVHPLAALEKFDFKRAGRRL